jgi:transposase-like protein
MKAKRRRHEPEFKARVAIEALKNVKTIQALAKEFEIHPVQVSEWKKQMLEKKIRRDRKNSQGHKFAGTGE